MNQHIARLKNRVETVVVGKRGPKWTKFTRQTFGVSPRVRDLGALSGPLAGVSFIAGVAGATTLADSPYPRPGSEPAVVRRYFNGNPGAARVSVAGQLISAASLARFTASVATLAARSGRGERGLRTAAIVGGGLAAASLTASALISAALTGRQGENESRAATLHRWGFILGGPTHGVGLGVLLGALGVSGLRTGELPRPLAIAGLASASAGLLSPLYFVRESAAWFIPAGRFSGLLISGIAGGRLGGSRANSVPGGPTSTFQTGRRGS